MTTEHNFLITYGLHNFVSLAQRHGTHTFTIQGAESQKMVNHAKFLIKERYGMSADIKVI